MKTFFTLLLLIPLTVFAQEFNWFEAGSSWTYNYGTFASPEHYQATFEISETVFAGEACAKMEPDNGNPFGCFPVEPPFYFYESNDSIFYATEADSTFLLAYNFNAVPGESWVFIVPFVEYNLSDTFNVMVQNVNSVMIDGQTIKELQLEYTNISQEPIMAIYPQEISVLEYAGAIGNFFVPFGQLGACDNETNVKLQCFSSPSFHYVNPEFGTCLLSVPSIKEQTSLQIYPNPASESITLELPGNERGTIRIIQLDGKIIFNQSLTSVLEKITLPSLSPGMYIVEVSNAESRHYGKLQIR